MPGELFIGGAGLARGYWRDETKTQACFPTSPLTGERLYRTGDRGRYLPDGNIEFLGRDDLQVKVGGHRVELGEVEAILLQHPDIEQAAVVVFADEQQQRRLAAFSVPRPGRTLSPLPLRDFLRSRLPEYMVPVRWFTDAVLPLTTNGKLDRKALAARATAAPPARANGKGEPLPPPKPAGNLADDPVIQHLLTSPGIVKEPLARKALVQERRAVRTDLKAHRCFRLPGEVTGEMQQHYARRYSSQSFTPEVPRCDKFAALLAGLRGLEVNGKVKFLYPSAGASYSLQCYLLVKQGGVEGLPAGTYYYHPLRHELQQVGDLPSVLPDLHLPANRALFDQASFALFLVADLGAIQPLYGDLGLDLARVEAGYLAQVLVGIAPTAGLGLCPIGYLHFTPLRPLFALKDQHVLVHSLVGGVPAQVEAVNGTQPAQPAERPGEMQDEAPPSVGLVEEVTAIWTEVLQVPQVDPDTHFFELGGSSFALVEVHRRLVERLGQTCAVTELFQFPTVRSLAAFLACEKHVSVKTDAVAEREKTKAAPTRREQRRRIRTQIAVRRQP